MSEPASGAPEARKEITTRSPPGGLPGEFRLDSDLVKSAVLDLNRIHLTCALDYCLKVGEYILSSFFEGRAENFQERSRSHVTFRRLAENEGLSFSSSYLWASVAVALQYQHLPSAIAENLPLSHHRILLGVEDVEKKRRLARQALESGLSKRQFDEVVRDHRDASKQRPGPGRPAHPPVLKHLTKIDEAVKALALEGKPNLEVPDRFKQRVGELAGRVRDELAMLQELLTQVEEGTRSDEPSSD